MVSVSTVSEAGKLAVVSGLIPTAFQPEFVIMTACGLVGRTPSDQFDESCQLLLLGFIHEFTCAEAEASGEARTNAWMHRAQPGPPTHQNEVCIIVRVQ